MADRSAAPPLGDYGWGACIPHTQAYLLKPLLRLLQQGIPSGSRTLSQLLHEAGFVDLRFVGAGRWPWLWKSMLMAGRRP